jgi:hypothetical protein
MIERGPEPGHGSVLGKVAGIIGCVGCGCAVVLLFLLLMALVFALLA